MRVRCGSGYALFNADCLEVLSYVLDCSIDSLVTDPPAGISFMRRTWDHPSALSVDVRSTPREAFVAGLGAVMRECLRVLKPGAHALVWALPRTSHWTAMAIEYAGFEISDVLTHLFATGFPKSLNLSGEWKGWGSALKPAAEHWILARKPRNGTIANNVDTYGTGALNIDGCRIATHDDLNGGAYAKSGVDRWDGDQDWRFRRTGRSALSGDDRSEVAAGMFAAGAQTPREFVQPPGRWPANIVLSHHEDCQYVGTVQVQSNGHFPAARGVGGIATEGHAGQAGLTERHTAGEVVDAYDCVEDCPVRLLGAQSGRLHAPGSNGRSGVARRTFGEDPRAAEQVKGRGDSGTAARFFYNAKASRRERSEGVTQLLWVRDADRPSGWRLVSQDEYDQHGASGRAEGNIHPTVKSLELMRYWIRLITPPGGVVLDPFAGSGSTPIAAVVEGCSAVAVEKDDDYFTIMDGRVLNAVTHDIIN